MFIPQFGFSSQSATETMFKAGFYQKSLWLDTLNLTWQNTHVSFFFFNELFLRCMSVWRELNQTFVLSKWTTWLKTSQARQGPGLEFLKARTCCLRNETVWGYRFTQRAMGRVTQKHARLQKFPPLTLTRSDTRQGKDGCKTDYACRGVFRFFQASAWKLISAFINLLWCSISMSQISFATPPTETAQQQ